MNAGPRHPIVPPADLTRFLVAFGLVPLLLARDFQRDVPPWSIALTPTWSMDQLAFIGLAGTVLGVTSGRPAQGLAGVTLGVLMGLAADLRWLAGWVTPYDQSFVTMLPQAEWHSRMTESSLALLGAVSAGFLIGAVVRRLIQDRSGSPLRPPSGTEAVAVGVAVIGAPLLALGIVAAAASSALVVPDGAQVQTVRVSAEAITMDLPVLRPGPTRFRCHFGPDAKPVWAYLISVPEDAEVQPTPPTFDDYDSSCGLEPGSLSWGTIADLQSGRYVWAQIDRSTTDPRTITTSPIFVVAP